MTSCDLIASIAVENTAYTFDKLFSYAVPAELEEAVRTGSRVIVPFGKGTRKRQGIIFSLERGAAEGLKKISEVTDESPVLSEELLALARFMRERCFCTYYEAVKAMLPAGVNYRLATAYGARSREDFDIDGLSAEELRIYAYLEKKRGAVQGKSAAEAFGLADCSILDKMVGKNALYRCDKTYRGASDAVMKMVAPAPGANADDVGLTKRQREIYDVINICGGVSVKDVRYFTGASPSVINALSAKGLVYFYDEEVFRTEHRSKSEKLKPLELSAEQQRACDSLYDDYRSGKPCVSLLYGVTGSGKTSVFIKLIERVIDDGRGIIVMVPEISLTPQFVSAFSERFGDAVAVFHSALSPGERLDEYKRVKKGLAQIAIGTRSAVFAPFENIGLVIIDEEQEYSYKSENSPRYHARDAARFRCFKNNALLVLSSATPGVETYYYASTGKYHINTLENRYGSATLPDVVVADMNEELQNGNTSGFSEVLLERLEYNLSHKLQSILLLNRRGHNTFVTCRSCREAVTCPNCSISLIYHSANDRLMCHYCGYSVKYTGKCPTCGSDSLRLGGVGTQKAEKDISEIFPQARVLRMDTDAASSKSSYEKMISAFSNGEYDILVGTQMVAKGLDFPKVTLVGVLNADHMLYADDYRSYERSFSLLTQVVGRSGRGSKKGTAVIQSYTPDNLIISMAAKQDYKAFFGTEIKIRRAMLYPPFADICLIGFVGENQNKTLNAARGFLKMLTELAQSEYPKLPLRVLGPSPALVVRVSNKFRYKLIIKCRNCTASRQLISRLLVNFGSSREFSGVTAYADMNALVC